MLNESQWQENIWLYVQKKDLENDIWGLGRWGKAQIPWPSFKRTHNFFFTDIPIILTSTTIPLHLIWESMVERVLLFESVKKKKYLRTCKIWCHFCHTIRVLLLLCITSTENANRHSLFIHMECMWRLCAQICNKKMSLGYFLKQTVGQSYKTQMEDGSIIVARWQQEKSILYDKQVKSGIDGHFHCNFS